MRKWAGAKVSIWPKARFCVPFLIKVSLSNKHVAAAVHRNGVGPVKAIPRPVVTIGPEGDAALGDAARVNKAPASEPNPDSRAAYSFRLAAMRVLLLQVLAATDRNRLAWSSAAKPSGPPDRRTLICFITHSTTLLTIRNQFPEFVTPGP
jgi:hypothetical protein